MRDAIDTQAFGMVIKPYAQSTTHKDPRQRAGAAAENQMAHYLHREFKDDPEVYILHSLRIEDSDQPEQDGSIGVCQIDHLVVHRWGMFIIESKSVTQEVQVGHDGSDGDEWSRVNGTRKTGMPSPIQQARRQSEFLRAFLQRHRTELVGRMPLGQRDRQGPCRNGSTELRAGAYAIDDSGIGSGEHYTA